MRPKIVLLTMSIFISLPTFALSLEEQLSPAFKAYNEGSYEEAKSLFLQVQSNHPDNGFILYNLGLAEYKLGNLGMALGLWDRALNLNSSLDEALTAIDYTLDQLQPVPDRFQTTSALDFVRYFYLKQYPLTVVLLLNLIIAFMFWRLLLTDLMHRKDAQMEQRALPSYRTITWVFLSVGIVLFVFSILKVYDATLIKGVVVSKHAPAKAGPGEDQVTLFEMTEGSELVILDKQDRWLKISTPRAKLGWLSTENVYVTAGKLE